MDFGVGKVRKELVRRQHVADTTWTVVPTVWNLIGARWQSGGKKRQSAIVAISR